MRGVTAIRGTQKVATGRKYPARKWGKFTNNTWVTLPKVEILQTNRSY